MRHAMLETMVEVPGRHSADDPLGQFGYLTWRVGCGECGRYFGQWERIGIGAPSPAPQAVHDAARALLQEQGFRETEHGVVCPECGGQGPSPHGLSEGTAPDPEPWFSEWTGASR